jgi:hypothetical protein
MAQLIRTYRPIVCSALVLASLTVAVALGVSPVRAATNRYVGSGGNCGNNTPCYSSINAALAASQNNDTIIILNNVVGSNNQVGSSLTGITIKGANANVIIQSALIFPTVNNWTIQDLGCVDAIVVKSVTNAITIQNTRPLGIFVKPPGDLNATVNILNNTLTSPSTSEISFVGTQGASMSGRYTVTGNTGFAYVNIQTYVNPAGGSANLNATITLDSNIITSGVNIGVTQQNNGQTGNGNITGSITFNNNTVADPTNGLNVFVGSRPAGWTGGANGFISGNMVFTNNTAAKIACITIDAPGTTNYMSGSITATGNVGEYIELGFQGDFTGPSIIVTGNTLNYKQTGAVITIRANTFARTTTITVEDNSGRMGIIVNTFTGDDNATISIQRNTTLYIAVRAQVNHVGPLTIADNNISANGYPISSPDNDYISLATGSGAFKGASILRNTAPKFSLVAASNLSGALTVTGNTFTLQFLLNAQGGVGPGVATVQSNRIGTNVSDASTILNVTTNINFNAMLGQLGGSVTTINAINNWWGCNTGPGTSGCGAAPNASPFLIFSSKLVCTGSNAEVINGFDVTQNSRGQYFMNISIPGTVSVAPNTGFVQGGSSKPLKPGFSWNSASILVSAGASVSVTTTLDRQAIAQTRSCPIRTDTVGVFRNGQWLLKTANDSSGPYIIAWFGASTWLPVTGDWDGNGIDTFGGYDSTTGVFYYRNTNTTGSEDGAFVLGNPGDTPLAGRWDPTMAGDGAGVFRPSNGIIYLKRNLSSGFSDYFMVMGNPGDKGVAGDWDGDGYDGPGVFRPSQGRWYISNNGTANGIIFDDGFADFGPINDSAAYPVTGDWNRDSTSGIGIFKNGAWSLRFAPTGSAAANLTFTYGQAGDRPVAGHWTSTPYDPPPANILLGPSAPPAPPVNAEGNPTGRFD